MSMATFSLLAAIVSGLVVAASVVATSVVAANRPPSPRDASTPVDPRPRIRIGHLLVGGLVGALCVVVSMFVANRALRMTVFGGISVSYLFLVVGVPLGAACVLGWSRWAGRRGTPPVRRFAITRPAAVACIAALLLGPVGVYATHIEPSLLDVDRPAPLAVAADRVGEEPITIGVLTDLQTPSIGDRDRRAVDELMAARPDLILLPGDIIQAPPDEFARELPALRDLLGRLSAPGGVFLVGGDVDQPVERLDQMVEGTGVRYLDDEVVTTSVRDRTVTIGGIGVDYETSAALAVIDQLESESESESEPGDGDIRILLSHRPDPVLARRSASRIDLQVSGHTHGGQIAVPFVGPIMTLTEVPRHVAAGGLHDLDGNAIYVGRGVGLERGQAPQMRFGVRPDIGILTLTG